jgi:hypothetical protein
MPDTKITALTAIGANPIIPATFPIPMVDLTDTSMAASGTTKKVTVNQILGAGGTATLASATITGDLTAARLNVTGATIPANGVYLASANNLTFAFNSTLGMSLNAGGLLVNNTTGFNSVANIKLKVGGRFLSGISGVGAYSFGTADAGGFVINDAGDGSTESRLLTLNATGLGVGGSPASKLYVYGSNVSGIGQFRIDCPAAGTAQQTFAINGTYQGQLFTDGTKFVIGTPNSTPIVFRTNLTEALTIDASQNVGVGVTPSAWVSTYKALQISSYASFAGNSDDKLTAVSNNFYNDGTAKFVGNGYAASYSQYQGAHRWQTSTASNSSGAGAALTFTQAMTLDASGNLSLGQSSSALQSGGTGITVFGTSASEIKFLNSTTGSSATDGTALVTTGNNFSINNREAGAVAIGTSNTERVSVKTNGQVRFVPLAADPASAEAGDVYYNSTSNKLKCYNGTTWNDLF